MMQVNGVPLKCGRFMEIKHSDIAMLKPATAAPLRDSSYKIQDLMSVTATDEDSMKRFSARGPALEKAGGANKIKMGILAVVAMADMN